MTMTTCYTVLRSSENDQRLLEDEAAQLMRPGHKQRRAGRPKGATKKGNQMAAPTAERTIKTQKSVFDLVQFDDVTLVKYVKPPEPVTQVSEALARLNNDTEALMRVINKGLEDLAVQKEREIEDGWSQENEDGELTPYTGKFASEEQGKKINGAVLSMAKVLGYDKSLTAEQKSAIKKQAMDFIRTNPAIIESVQKA